MKATKLQSSRERILWWSMSEIHLKSSHNKVSHTVYIAPSFCFFIRRKPEEKKSKKNCTIILSHCWERLAVHYSTCFCSFLYPNKPGPHNNNKDCIVSAHNTRRQLRSEENCFSLRCAKILINLIWFMIALLMFTCLRKEAIRGDHNKASTSW